MDVRQLSRIDLNLLVALQVLLEERSVSRAAERVFVSQSAMSKILGRLRQMFDDPLFTRTPHGIIPTPRAEKLQQQLASVLSDVEGLIAPEQFDPASYNGEFILMVPDYLGLMLVPKLTALLAQEAPNIRLEVINQTVEKFSQLGEGGVDFAVQIEHHDYPPDLNIAELEKVSMVVLSRKGHPLQDPDFTYQDALQYPQIQFYIPDLGESEFFHQHSDLYARLSELKTTLGITQLHTALEVLRNTDYLMVSPSLLAGEDIIGEDIVASDITSMGSLDSRYVLVWHQRIDHSLPHRYMRSKILEVINEYRQHKNLPPVTDV